MIKLTPLEPTINTYRKLIFNSDDETVTRGQELLGNCFEDISDRLELYRKNAEKLEGISCKSIAANKSTRDKLYNMYDSEAQHIDELKKKINNIEKTRCPYCGTLESPYQIDHYIPRSLLPEYSIFSLNLIPACASCNQVHKRNKFYDPNQKRVFFNPYFDNFIEETQFLKCTLTVDRHYLCIKFDIDGSMLVTNPYEYSIMKNHFKAMNLGERYRNLVLEETFKRFREELIDFNEDIKSFEWIDVTIEKLKEKIDDRLRGLRSHNQNHWEKVFWLALKNCDEILDLIVSKELHID